MSEINPSGQLPQVLLVDDNADFLVEACYALRSTGLCYVKSLTDSTEVLGELDRVEYAALFIDWIMPALSGADLLPVIVQKYPSLPVIIMTGVSDVDNVVNCMKQGATDYITKPLDLPRITSCLRNVLRIRELSNQNRLLQGYLLGNPVSNPDAFAGIITCSDKMLSIFKLIETMSHSRQPVLITGETGVGKELIATAVHRASGVGGCFVPLNVAGLDSNMFEDTLFGHRKGSFTGAVDAREGLISKAQGGTLFLDEIGDLSRESQIKLLRLIQEHEYYRVGSDLLQKSTARIIAASNRNFEKLMQEGLFREDLYHRISFHRLHIPPLRERRDDILPLVLHYAAVAAESVGKATPCFSEELGMILTGYSFSGNVRELVNVVGRAVMNNRSGLLTEADFPGIFMDTEPVVAGESGNWNGHFCLHAVFPRFPAMAEVEQLMLQEALKKAEWRKGEAADLLGISRQTLRKWMEIYKVE